MRKIFFYSVEWVFFKKGRSLLTKFPHAFQSTHSELQVTLSDMNSPWSIKLIVEFTQLCGAEQGGAPLTGWIYTTWMDIHLKVAIRVPYFWQGTQSEKYQIKTIWPASVVPSCSFSAHLVVDLPKSQRQHLNKGLKFFCNICQFNPSFAKWDCRFCHYLQALYKRWMDSIVYLLHLRILCFPRSSFSYLEILHLGKLVT